MSTLQRISQTFAQGIQRTMTSLATSMARIFGPSDDHYPKTGVQPFEGDVPDPNKTF